MKSHILNNSRGFTLAELLVAITILAIGLLSVAGMQIVALKSNSSANAMTVNASIAEGILEEILSWPLDDPRVIADTSTPVVWVFDDETAAAMTASAVGVGTYTATYSVDVNYDSGAGSIPNVTRIEVNVIRSGGQRTITLVGFKRAV